MTKPNFENKPATKETASEQERGEKKDWQKGFYKFCNFCQINKRFPNRKDTEGEAYLFYIYENYKLKNKILSAERKRKLDAFDEYWCVENYPFQGLSIEFRHGWEKYLDYKKEIKKEIVSTTKYKGYNLGSFCQNLRRKLKGNKLTKEQLALLDGHNTSWRLSSKDKYNYIKEEDWQRGFDNFCGFCLKIKRFPNQKDTKGEAREAYRFYKRENDKLKNKILSAQRKRKLDDFDEYWCIGNYPFQGLSINFRRGWEKYLEYKKEINEEVICKTKYKGYNLGNFCQNLRRKIKENKLTKEQLAILTKYNFSWEFRPQERVINIIFMANIDFMKEHIQERGIPPLEDTLLPDKQKYGQWRAKFGSRLIEGKLSAWQQEELKNLKINFIPISPKEPISLPKSEIPTSLPTSEIPTSLPTSEIPPSLAYNAIPLAPKNFVNEPDTKRRLKEIRENEYFKTEDLKNYVIENIYDLNWLSNYYEVQAIKQKTGDFPKISNGVKAKDPIRKWLKRQRLDFQHGHLRQDQLVLLLQIGFLKIKEHSKAA